MSFAGELGWELYAPVESAPVLYDQLIEAGELSGCATPATSHSTACARRRASSHWGADVGPADTPLEAGLSATVALDKPGGFIGREALAAAAAAAPPPRAGAARRPGAAPLPRRDRAPGRPAIVGRVTSGAYGHTLGAAVGLAALDGEPAAVDEIVAGGAVEVEIAARRYSARLSGRPFYDPDGRRLRGG